METNTIAPEVIGADPLLKEDRAAAFLGLSIKTLQNKRVLGGGPPYVKLGAGLRAPVRYRLSVLRAYVESCTRGSTAEHAAKAAA